MRIEQLEYVVAVTRYGSLRRASEQLHISQPALSEAVSKLERELGVTLLERRRSGAQISTEGRQLLELMVDVLEAVERLGAAARDPADASRAIRVGTVSAGTTGLLLSAVRSHQAAHPGSRIEVRSLQQDEIQAGLSEGGLDLGLVNLLAGDPVPADLDGIPIRRGRPVAVLPADHRLAERDVVTADDLRDESFVGMRPGYVMHRFTRRLFGDSFPPEWHGADGAEMGKMMVAERLGVTVLPDYSVIGDPLERSGLIVRRPIAGTTTTVTLTVMRRRRGRPPAAVLDMIATLRAEAARLQAETQAGRAQAQPA